MKIVSCVRFCQHPILSLDLAKKAMPALAFRLYAGFGEAGSVAADYLASRKRRGLLQYHEEVTALDCIRARALQLDDVFELMRETLPTRLTYELVDREYSSKPSATDSGVQKTRDHVSDSHQREPDVLLDLFVSKPPGFSDMGLEC